MNNTKRLNGNQLKLIALAAMTLDHIGMQLLPQVVILRIIGRLAFPIFAYMVAEGCQYTHSRPRYLLGMAGLAAVCQAAYWFVEGSLYMSVLVSFTLAILIIYAIDFGREKGGLAWVTPVLALGLAVFACLILPKLLPGTNYAVDYGIWGVLLPVFTYLGTSKTDKLALFTADMILLNRTLGGIQWFSILTLILLYLYDGTRGKKNLKYLFYIYYPLHLVVLWVLQMVL